MSKTLAMAGFLLAGMVAGWADDNKDVEESLHQFKKAMANPSAPARAAAVADLARTPSEKAAVTIGALLGTEADAVKIAAGEGLGNFHDYKKVAMPLLLAGLNANAKEPKILEAIFKGLGKLSDTDALPTIHQYFDDKEADVAKAALMSAAEIRNVSSIDVMITLMKKYEKIDEQAKKGGGGYGVPYGGQDPKGKLAKDVLPTIIKALQGITHEKWATTKEWEIWWNKYKATFKIDK
ncbi:MAG TPA: HEAT repeat domain-containing protein [Planctomycetota bacterium]|nr:HEAT repeat domain-containing protein [Planctomycetota bacterium]